MRRNFYHAVFLEHGIFTEHAVNAAAERAFVRVGPGCAAAPTLKKIPGNTIPNFHLRHAWTDLDHFSSAVRKRDEVFAHRHSIAAARDGKIAEIERACPDLPQHLSIGWPRVGPIHLHKRLDPGAAFRQLIGAHDFPPSKAGRSALGRSL